MRNFAVLILTVSLVHLIGRLPSKWKNFQGSIPGCLIIRPDRSGACQGACRRQGVEPFATAVDSLKKMAGRAMMQGSFSVMQKKMMPPSGDKHDYYSLGPYWWPNPDTPDGLPYVRHDGIRNPEYADYDRRALGEMATSVFTLALAWFYTGHEPYADKSVELLRTWFLDPSTRMNPHLEYGQAIPGRTEGRGIGIIETGSLVDVVNGIGMMKGSEAMTEDDLMGA